MIENRYEPDLKEAPRQDKLLRAGIKGRLPSRRTDHWFSSAAIVIDILEWCPVESRCNCLWSNLAYEHPEDAHWLRTRQWMILRMTENMGLLEGDPSDFLPGARLV